MGCHVYKKRRAAPRKSIGAVKGCRSEWKQFNFLRINQNLSIQNRLPYDSITLQIDESSETKGAHPNLTAVHMVIDWGI